MKNKFDYYLLNFLTVILFSFAGCSVANSNETKNTAPTFHVQTQNPDAKPTRVIPEYVTAWPKQVAVEKPDPVLGDKLVWEHWIYGEEFAKRFEGFPIEKADKELLNSPIKAVVLRLFKKNLWEGINPNFPEQYTVDIDLYFDSTIKIPLSEKFDTDSPLRKYPKGIEASFKKLVAMKQDDKKSIKEIVATIYRLKQGIYMFATPIDGRFIALGSMHYYPTIVSGLSFITFRKGQTSGVAVPLQTNGALWLSLLGDRTFDVHEYPTSVKGGSGLYKKTDKVFEPDEHSEKKGYVKLPRLFYEVALPKMALIEDLNYCISQHYAYETNPNKKPSQERNEFFQWCDDTKNKGVIFNPSDYLSNTPKHNGLVKIGF